MATGAGTDHLGEARHPDAQQLPLFAHPALLLAQPLVVGHLERQVEGLLVVAGVVLEARRRCVGKLLGADEVRPPQLHGIHAQLIRG